MTLPIAIVMGMTLVLCVLGWKLGDVFRDWMAVRRLSIENVVVRAENAVAIANERIAEIETLRQFKNAHSEILYRLDQTAKAHADALEALRIRTMRG